MNTARILLAFMLMLGMVLVDAGCSKHTEGIPDAFEFAVSWGVGSSYDSETDTLIKTTQTDDKDKFTVRCELDAEQMKQIHELLTDMDVLNAPKTLPSKGPASKPCQSIKLTVRYGDAEITVSAEGISDDFRSTDSSNGKFLDGFRQIVELLTATGEWKSLPEYETLWE